MAVSRPLLLSMGYLFFIPIVHGISNLEAVYAAKVLEKFVSVVGIILIVPLCVPELNTPGIKECLYGKLFSYRKTIVIRMGLSVITLLFLISFFAVILKILHCEFPLGVYIIGTLITSGTIGMVGFAAALISNNLILGYIISVGYFFMCWTGIINEESLVYLFSMINNQLRQKGALLFMTGLCIAGIGIRLTPKTLK